MQGRSLYLPTISGQLIATYCSNLSKLDPDRQISEFPLHCDPVFENTPHNIKELFRNLNNNS